MPESRGKYHHGDLRAALIATGLELTRSGGPEALRLREVTGLVGVSPNAAYRHFTNHQALLAAVAAEIQDRMAGRMNAHDPSDESTDSRDRALGRLRAVGLGYVGFAVDEPGWFQLAFFTPQRITRPDGQAPPPLKLLHQALDALVDAGVLMPARRPGAEWSCWSTVHGFAELATHGPLRGEPRQIMLGHAERVVDDIITGVINT